MQRGKQRYQHWFDGDGMVQSFLLEGQELVHQGRLVHTRRLKAESDAGRYLWPGFGSVFPDGRPVRSADDMNVANISVLPLEDELLALWEAGSAWRMDPATLETKGRKVFSADSDGLSFSAHPRRDTQGHIWNFGYAAGSGKLALYELAGNGALRRLQLVDAPNADMVHDFAVTQRYLVFVLVPLQYQQPLSAAPRSFVEQLTWNEDVPAVVLIIDKDSLEPVHRFELDPFFAFHLGNAYEDGDQIRIDVARTAPFDDMMLAIREAMIGVATASLAPEQAMTISVDLVSKTVRTQALPIWAADFPRYDQRHTGQRASRLFMMGEATNRPRTSFGQGTVIAYDHVAQAAQRFHYPEHVIAEEHLFVAAPGAAEGIGWLLGTSYDPLARQTSLAVFDSTAVADGPICTARLPYHLPLGFHGQFVPA